MAPSAGVGTTVVPWIPIAASVLGMLVLLGIGARRGTFRRAPEGGIGTVH